MFSPQSSSIRRSPTPSPAIARVHPVNQVQQRIEPLIVPRQSLGLRRVRRGRAHTGHVPQLVQPHQHRLHLALHPLTHDRLHQRPHIALRPEVLLAIPALVHSVHHPPVHQGPQRHARVATADLQPSHHVVGAQFLPGDEQQRVNLGHRARNAPRRAHLAPGRDEAVLCRGQDLVAGSGWRIVVVHHGEDTKDSTESPRMFQN
jgi:hypothetical protein